MHSAPLALVNETFARRYFPEGEILGRSLKIPPLKNEPPYTLAAPGSDGWLQVVGVVADALDDGLDKPVRPAIFVPYSLYMWMHTQILIRSRTIRNRFCTACVARSSPSTLISRRWPGG